MFFHSLGYPVLELVLVFGTDFLHSRLALRAFLPFVLRRFVAADVDVLGWEERRDFVEDIFVEFHRLLVAGACDAGEDAAFLHDFVWAAGAPVLREDVKHGHRVAGDFDFGNDGDVALGAVVDDFFSVFLGVESAVHSVFAVVSGAGGRQVKSDAGSPCALLDEFGVFFDFDTPCLVFGEVPVEDIQFE